MYKITAISVQEKNKDRCNLFLDGEFYAGISLEVALLKGLKVGESISEEALISIVFESDKAEALKRAINYVSKALKTKKQLKVYLIQKGYCEEVVKYCLEKLSEYKLIDDVEYSRRYIESVSKKQGMRLTEYKLMMKGVKKADIDLAKGDIDLSEIDSAFEIAKKHLKNKEITKENLAKTYKYLIGKGFSYEQANYAISKFKGGDVCTEF